MALKRRRTLHHVSLLLSFCLMSGIPWISHYDLPLFATAPLLYMSFQSFNCLDAGHRADPFHPFWAEGREATGCYKWLLKGSLEIWDG